MKKILTYTLILLFFAIKPVTAAEESKSLIKEIEKEYLNTDNYSCTGKVRIERYVNDFVANELIINFVIKLKRPNHFLVHWKQEVVDAQLQLEGAIWSEENKYYYYQKDSKMYFELSSPEKAFSIATGVSSGIAYRIPSLFFNQYFKNNWLSTLKEPNSHKNIDNSVQISGVAISSDSIEKYQLKTLKGKLFLSSYRTKMTEPNSNKKQIEELKKRRKEIEENKSRYEQIFEEIDDSENKTTVEPILRHIDKKIDRLSRLPENNHIEHSVEFGTFDNISTNKLNPEAFKFQVPLGVKLKTIDLNNKLK